MAPKKTTRVSPSARGEGSKPKPVAKKVSPSKRGEGSTNTKGIVAMKKKTANVQEAGVANVAGTVAKAAIAVGKKLSSKIPKTKPTIAKSAIKRTPTKTQESQKAWREAEIQARATKLKAEKELAAIARKRASVEKMGAEGSKRQSAKDRYKDGQWSGKKATTAAYKGKRMTDNSGQGGWR